MLSSLCQELRNWFDRGQPKIHGVITITSGHITNPEFLEVIQNNQYFRVVGSVFNDGVYQYTNNLTLSDEVFDGSIWLMAIPKDVLDLNTDIDNWLSKYGDAVNSPYQSESFGGYSYSKASGSNGGTASWVSTFASRLNQWRKL